MTPLVMNMQAREVPPFVCTTLSVLTTFPIFYAVCMGNHRTIIGNVVEGSVTCKGEEGWVQVNVCSCTIPGGPGGDAWA